MRSTLQRAGCSQDRTDFLEESSAQFLTPNPRLRLRSLSKCHFQVTSTGPRSEVRPTPAASLTSCRLCHTADEWQMRLDCAQMENDFLRKRLQQCEERLDSEMKARTELEQKVREGGGSGPESPKKLISSLPPPILIGHCVV